MKKIMLVVALMVATVSANAQVYVGGGLGFSSDKPQHAEGVDVKTTTSYHILPEVGYKLDDKLSVGIQLGYSHSKAGEDKKDEFTIAPYARYTFVKWGNVGLFTDAQFLYNHVKDGELKTNTWSLGLIPGVSIDVTKNLTFLTKIGWLGYKSEKKDIEGNKASSDFGFDVSGEKLQFALLYNF